MSSEEYVVVSTCNGLLRGKKVNSARRGSYLSFQGIPYARPPLGELRFKDPLKVESWSGTRDALTEGPTAPSIDMITKKVGENCNEDCLYLNVYTPKVPENAQNLLPVMFWIHGGGFNSGSGNTDFYGPDYLITENVVLVTCNYRLGALGFLSLQSRECPGNYGLKDIVMALKWCQENIATFGGDPKNVTIFGESAGGAAVHYLALSKKTEGLFHKAIVMSGVAFNPWAFARKPLECAFKLGELLGCRTNDPNKLLQHLKSASPEDLVTKGKSIIKEVEKNEHFLDHGFLPCLEPEGEGALLTKYPQEIYESGDFRKIPFMIGSNTLEGLIVLPKRQQIKELKTYEDFERLVPRNWNVEPGSKEAKEFVSEIRKAYFPDNFNEKKYVDILSEVYFLNGINQTIEYHSKFCDSQNPTYVYKFSYNGNTFVLKNFLGFESWEGTCHGDELSYLFKQHIIESPISSGTKDFTVMEIMTKIWTNFAKTGTPMEDGRWNPIRQNKISYLDINEAPTEKLNPNGLEYEFWKNLYKIVCTHEHSKL